MNIKNEFMALMGSGGPIMWVIFFVACIAMALVLWEALRGQKLVKSARRDYYKLRTSDDYLPIENGSVSPVAQLLATTHWPEVQSREDMAREFNIHLAEITPKVEGSLATIAILASLLPMLGLLGTVTGMINVFEVIALHGSGKPDEMADGISQALLTTASGLIIAIPVIFLHHLLSRRVNILMAMTHQAIQVILHRDVSTLKKAYHNVNR
ncbi:MotA/TolQ/ExbB proton channel family protein [hydrothermal vent metagenome]|uniref:MotA/TolQ/ExbB proton channel family protein n=1 Tax=hydrothermal vent metagenome TaxID=652676 RepID=A0A3B1A9Q1_9ZZZZ